MPIRLTASPIGQGAYRVRVELPREGGRRQQRIKVIRCTPGELEDRLEAYRVELHAQLGTEPETPRLTLEAWAATWLQERSVLSGLNPNTLSTYTLLIQNHVVPTWGHYELQELTNGVISRGFRELGRRLAPASLRHVRTRLSALLRGARAAGHEVPIDAVQIPLPARPAGRAPSLTEEQLTRLLTELEAHRLGPIMRFMLATGITRAEACALRWKHYDPSSGELTVRCRAVQFENGGTVVLQPRKDGTMRFNLHDYRNGYPRAQAMRERAAEQAAMLGLELGTMPIFTSATGEAWRPSSLSQAIRNLGLRIGLDLTTHMLRKSPAARRALTKGKLP